jgi:hypothetical protein
VCFYELWVGCAALLLVVTGADVQQCGEQVSPVVQLRGQVCEAVLYYQCWSILENKLDGLRAL